MYLFKSLLMILIAPLLLLTNPTVKDTDTGTLEGIVRDKQTSQPLAGANVMLQKTSVGTATDLDGKFRIPKIPAGTYNIQITYIGYESKVLNDIKIEKNKVTKIDEALEFTTIEGEEVVVTGKAQGQLNAINQQLSANKIKSIVTNENIFESRDENSSSVISRLPGITNSNGEKVVIRGISPSEGDVDFNTEEYDRITDNKFLTAIKNPLSTFSIDVDAASYSNSRRFLNQGMLPPKDAVRTEEFINYFDYDYPFPDKHPVKTYTEYSSCPWNQDHYLVHIGLQGEKILDENKPASNLVFLIDVSGSMTPANKLPLLKRSFKLLVQQLKEEDMITIVVYAGAAGLVLPPTRGSDKNKIFETIDRLEAGGSTAGGEGIMLAYKMAEENFIKKGNNRVILATDGDFNIGISNTSELVRFLEEKREKGIFLTVLGFGEENIKDSRLEKLADNGNGHYAYIDNIMEGKKVFVNELGATLYTIAKDVKIQIEFNPAKVESYRLIGYENRLLNREDFEDDKKDAGEIGSGHTVTALYEIVPAGENAEIFKDDLRYSDYKIKVSAKKTDEILTVKIRYKEPDEEKSKMISSIVKDKPVDLNKTTDNFRFSAAVAEFAMLLRDSPYKGDSDFNQVLDLAKNSKGDDNFGYRSEFIKLVETAQGLAEPIGLRMK